MKLTPLVIKAALATLRGRQIFLLFLNVLDSLLWIYLVEIHFKFGGDTLVVHSGSVAAHCEL